MYKWILLGHAIGGATLFGAHVYLESLMAMAGRTADPSAYMLVMMRASRSADRVMGAASFVTLVFGIWLVIDGSYEWGDFFVTVGLSVIILAFAVSMFLLGPRFKEVTELVDEHGMDDEAAIAKMRSVGNLVHVETLLVAIAFVVMILKPGIG